MLLACSDRLLCVFTLSCDLLELFSKIGKLFLERRDLTATGKDARFLLVRTARKGAARVDHLTVKGHDLDAEARLARHFGCVIQIVEYHGSAKQRGNDVIKAGFTGYKVGSNADITAARLCLFHLSRHALRTHRGDREEGRAACLCTLERVDRRLCNSLVLHDDVLQIDTERDLNGSDVFLLYADDLGKRAVDLTAAIAARIGDATCLIHFHHVSDGMAVSLEMLLHRTERINTLTGDIGLDTVFVLLFDERVKRLALRVDLPVQRSDLTLRLLHLDAISLCYLLCLLEVSSQCVGGCTVGSDLILHAIVLAAVTLLAALQHLATHADIHCLGLALTDLGKRTGDLTRNGKRTAGKLLRLFRLGGVRTLQLGTTCLQLARAFATALALGDLSLQCLALHFSACVGGSNFVACVGNACFRYAILRFSRTVFARERLDLLKELCGTRLVLLRLLVELRTTRIEVLDSLLYDAQVVAAVTVTLLRFHDLLTQMLGIVKPKLYVRLLFHFVQLKRTRSAFCLLFKRTDLCRHLLEDVVHTRHVFLGGLQLSLRLRLMMTELGNARSILEHRTAIVGLERNDLCNLTLSDDGIAVAADTRVHEQLTHVAGKAGATVDEVLARTATVAATRDRHLFIGAIQTVVGVGVVEGNGNLRKAHRTATFRTAENDVLHLRTAQVLGRDLTQHPTHRVGNVRFTATVRADDNGSAALEGQLGLIGEGLESLQFQ